MYPTKLCICIKSQFHSDVYTKVPINPNSLLRGRLPHALDGDLHHVLTLPAARSSALSPPAAATVLEHTTQATAAATLGRRIGQTVEHIILNCLMMLWVIGARCCAEKLQNFVK
ncbi:hypothetical protein Taro_020506 [Colocasia esculenta]|uniref:Uncharacterized protein n=1 Tax=Colocasia esculenta TaxID=4460 RepID=A0A843V2J3_COLES|nr:hypothetical protein [Colocasia esculenta]